MLTRFLTIVIGPLLFSTAIQAQTLYIANAGGTGSVATYNTVTHTTNAGFLTGLYPLDNLAFQGNVLYVAESYNNSVATYTLSGTPINTHLITGLGGENPYDIAVSGSNLFVGEYSGIAEYTTSGTLVNQNFVSGLAGIGDFAFYGGNLYVVNNAGYTYSTLEEFNGSTGALINNDLISNLYDTFGMIISNGSIYTASYANGSVSEYTIGGALENANLVSGLGDAGVGGLAIYGNTLYISDAANGTIQSYDATSGALINNDLTTINYDPTGIIVVPEPGSVVLAMLGTLALAGIALRRRTRA